MHELNTQSVSNILCVLRVFSLLCFDLGCRRLLRSLLDTNFARRTDIKGALAHGWMTSLPATRPGLHRALPCEESQKTCHLPPQTSRGVTGGVDHGDDKAILPCPEERSNILEEELYEQREQSFRFPLLIPHGESDDVDCTNEFLFHFQENSSLLKEKEPQQAASHKECQRSFRTPIYPTSQRQASGVSLCINNPTVIQEGPREEAGSCEQKEQSLHYKETNNVNGTKSAASSHGSSILLPQQEAGSSEKSFHDVSFCKDKAFLRHLDESLKRTAYIGNWKNADRWESLWTQTAIWSVESPDAERVPTTSSSEKIQCSSSASDCAVSDTEDREDKFPSMPKRSQQTSCHWEQSRRSDLNLRGTLTCCALFLSYLFLVLCHVHKHTWQNVSLSKSIDPKIRGTCAYISFLNLRCPCITVCV